MTPQKCGAAAKGTGNPCRKPAGWGTYHPGTGKCKLHGGMAPSGNVAAAREELQKHSAVMGTQVDVTPQEALLVCVRIAAGEVAYATMKVQELEHEDAVSPVHEEKTRIVKFEKDGETFEAPITETVKKAPTTHIWIRVRQDSLDRLARFSKMAIDAGVAERQVTLAEETGRLVQDALLQLTHHLDLTPAQRKRVPGALLEVTSTMSSSGAQGTAPIT